jgi:PIN domain nuclease of toxin-antitoxin system
MRLLLDTHVLLWALAEPKRLAKQVRARLEDPAVEVLFSAASIWELAIKVQIGRIALPEGPEQIAAAAVESGFVELPVRSAAAAMTGRLPLHHRDPFDRLLIAQAVTEPAAFCTVDKGLTAYSGLVRFV